MQLQRFEEKGMSALNSLHYGSWNNIQQMHPLMNYSTCIISLGKFVTPHFLLHLRRKQCHLQSHTVSNLLMKNVREVCLNHIRLARGAARLYLHV